MLGSAAAADLPSRRPPPPVAYAPPLPIFTWTGFYVGVNGGGAFRGNNNSGFNNAVFFGGAGPLVGAGWPRTESRFRLEIPWVMSGFPIA
jgi:outer membrane immunogenic protein